MSLPFDQKYITFDTETEGLNLHNSRPWQLAWNRAKGNKSLNAENRFLYWSDLKVSRDAARITGFDIDFYENIGRDNHKYKIFGKEFKAENPEVVLNDFEKELYDPKNIIVGQNLLGYDVYIIATLQRICGKKQDFSYLSRIYDTRPLGMAYREGLTKPKNCDMLSWQYKILNDASLKAKVSQLAQLKFLGIEFDETKLHDALYDNEMCFQIFQAHKKNLSL